MIGTNDIRTGVSQATKLRNDPEYVAGRRAWVTRLRFTIFTILPSNIVPASGPDFGAQRQRLNTLIRNGGVCPYTVLGAWAMMQRLVKKKTRII